MQKSHVAFRGEVAPDAEALRGAARIFAVRHHLVAPAWVDRHGAGGLDAWPKEVNGYHAARGIVRAELFARAKDWPEAMQASCLRAQRRGDLEPCGLASSAFRAGRP